jgi:phospholipid-translocating ATPase
MIIAEVVTLLLYAISMIFLPQYFGALQQETSLIMNLLALDLDFVLSVRFAWKVAVLVAVSSVPLYVIKLVRSRVSPAVYSKLV